MCQFTGLRCFCVFCCVVKSFYCKCLSVLQFFYGYAGKVWKVSMNEVCQYVILGWNYDKACGFADSFFVLKWCGFKKNDRSWGRQERSEKSGYIVDIPWLFQRRCGAFCGYLFVLLHFAYTAVFGKKHLLLLL